eukprot:m.237725 g.237725  ORF g.237725 m.237725 type:complete len:660 (-) comp10911_c0_seq1:95-2074(-)
MPLVHPTICTSLNWWRTGGTSSRSQERCDPLRDGATACWRTATSSTSLVAATLSQYLETAGSSPSSSKRGAWCLHRATCPHHWPFSRWLASTRRPFSLVVPNPLWRMASLRHLRAPMWAIFQPPLGPWPSRTRASTGQISRCQRISCPAPHMRRPSSPNHPQGSSTRVVAVAVAAMTTMTVLCLSASTIDAQNETDAFVFVFGGATFNSYLNDLHVARVGCNPGYYSPGMFIAECLPCPRGRWNSVAGAKSCDGTCPPGTTTIDFASTSEANCTECVPGACHGHGECSVDTDKKISCHCHFGYRGSENCALPVDLIIIVVSIVITLLVTLVVQACHRMGKFRRQTRAAYTLLDQSQQEIAHLEETWEIDLADIHISRRIDIGSEGSWGEVYLGEWAGRQVAVKRLRQAAVQLATFGGSAKNNFMREIRVLRNLRHKNIVFFFGAGDLEGTPFLVTEFCERGSLQSVLADSTIELSLERRVGFALDAARGMQFLHSLTPIRLHRDLKSGNLLITKDWVVKIADFGTATLFNTAGLVQEGPANLGSIQSSMKMTQHVGTAPYIAPEVYDSTEYGPEMDVYSYGITLWEIMTRSEPYLNIASIWELRDFVLAGGRPEMPPGAPPALEWLATLCWAQDPTARPSFSEIVRRLEDPGVLPPDVV